jgi:hypothetical protein
MLKTQLNRLIRNGDMSVCQLFGMYQLTDSVLQAASLLHLVINLAIYSEFYLYFVCPNGLHCGLSAIEVLYFLHIIVL